MIVWNRIGSTITQYGGRQPLLERHHMPCVSVEGHAAPGTVLEGTLAPSLALHLPLSF